MTDSRPTDPEQIRQEIEETRADLADTVNALTTKLDVKAQAKAKANGVKGSVAETLSKAKRSAPPPVQNSLDRAGGALKPAVARAKPYRTQILAAGAVGAATILVLKRLRARRSR